MRTTMKTLALAASLLSLTVPGFSQQVAKSIPCSQSPDGLIGFLQFKPTDYGTQKHPLIIFMHGIGERGNGTSQINTVAYNGIPLYCMLGATMRFTVAGQTSSFVVLSPQLSASFSFWPPFYVQEMIKYAKANLEIDTNRIYITGLSLGGGGVWGAITNASDPSFDSGIAAAAPVCGTPQYDANVFCSTIGASHLPVWAFHSLDDGTVHVYSTQAAETISKNCGVNPASIFTYYQTGNHSGAWLNAYDTGHITRTTVVNGVATSFTANPNLYEWFLSHTRAVMAPAVAVPGPPQVIAATSTVLNAEASYSPNGSIASYSWQQVSGPAEATIVNANSATPVVTDMLLGSSYSFQLTVTDIMGSSGSAITGVTTISAALPVEFTYFKGQKINAGNILQWATATEQNNDYFSIERSEDGSGFADIGKVTGAGTSNAVNVYSFTDTRVLPGNNYYRLKQVDKDGRYIYSKVIIVRGDSKAAVSQIYPNPVQTSLSVVINNEVKGTGKIAVYDLSGHTVRQQAVVKNDQLLNAALNMNDLVPGLYMIEVKIGTDYKLTKTIMKK